MQVKEELAQGPAPTASEFVAPVSVQLFIKHLLENFN